MSSAYCGLASPDRIDNAFHPTTVERLQSYLRGLKNNRVDTENIPIYETLSDYAAESHAMNALFSSPALPTAILAQSDPIALYALTWLKEQNISVSAQVSIIGFDGVPEALTSQPSLTTMTQPIAEMSHKAVKILREQSDTPVRETLETDLVIRDSTASLCA